MSASCRLPGDGLHVSLLPYSSYQIEEASYQWELPENNRTYCVSWQVSSALVETTRGARRYTASTTSMQPSRCTWTLR